MSGASTHPTSTSTTTSTTAAKCGERMEEVACLSAKELKNLAKPEFAANPDFFYPTEVLKRHGFSRATCKCGHNYWRHSDKVDSCGDSNCVGSYTFIGRGCGKGRRGERLTLASAWEGFKRSFTSARIPCTPVSRYPVVARWRADVEYVAAGIYCYQPYCVTGELEPPANPLIQPQFCLRFNDLDNIGLSGRHYSGFNMLGIQVFNLPDKFVFFKEECVEFNLRWLIDELEIDPDEITLVEDVWAGGGNLGPSMEYFINGLELGNMVFMQYKTFPDGRRQPLQVQVIDVGIGLERVPWLINGSPTSYVDVFPRALHFMSEKIGIPFTNPMWERFGPYSCLLNSDESDMDQAWESIAQRIGVTQAELRAAIEPVRDMYIVCDHTRTVMIAIEDGSLPSNVGGAANLRAVLRRCLAVLKRHRWWDAIGGMDGFMQLFEFHRLDLQDLHGPFREYKSFRAIITSEYQRWERTDADSKRKLEALRKKSGGKLALKDWVLACTSYGMGADQIAEMTGERVPDSLYLAIATLQEKTVRVAPAALYDCAHLQPTREGFYNERDPANMGLQCNAVVQHVLPNALTHELNVVVCDQTCFYPLSGGQDNDTGRMELPDGSSLLVTQVMKAGHCILHVVDRPVSPDLAGQHVVLHVDVARRIQLRNHHTATHIVFAAARRVLGPHVWQNGAKKTVKNAHLEITHFNSLEYAEEQAIELEANRICNSCKPISKTVQPKDAAERTHGFSLYQGGVVPGNTLRVVSIADTDTEACCGTHCDNTSEVGSIRIINSKRTQDGIVRLKFVAGEKALEYTAHQRTMLHTMCHKYDADLGTVLNTVDRFYHETMIRKKEAPKQSERIVKLTMRCLLAEAPGAALVIRSYEDDMKFYLQNCPRCVPRLLEKHISVVFVGDTFVYGILGEPAREPVLRLVEALLPTELDGKGQKRVVQRVALKPASPAIQFKAFGGPRDEIIQMLLANGFAHFNVDD
eukprot:gnl/Spiro4/5989_TR3068_c0_g1_i1.p1 gnl/Spiro4/5989_TR3068_c0_g1~~gnl/Spiro4/5989_TR3068_c0_g1_i1.p1  ORF type:complete len:976 (+),score=410.67 gnl/Spiro4/5989_TR3068_c0_g1_i1:49-2976(+)